VVMERSFAYSLDRGGGRGHSSFQVLKQLMEFIYAKHPPKPYDYSDVAGHTATGSLIAIMLGRLRMSIEECMEQYKSLSSAFTKLHHRLAWGGQVQGRFDHEALVTGVLGEEDYLSGCLCHKQCGRFWASLEP
jgi:hypothetical protein